MKLKPEKKFRPKFFSGFNFTTAYVVCITAMIIYILIMMMMIIIIIIIIIIIMIIKIILPELLY